MQDEKKINEELLQYLSASRIYPLFQKLLVELLRKKPEDPLSFMIEKLKIERNKCIFVVGSNKEVTEKVKSGLESLFVEVIDMDERPNQEDKMRKINETKASSVDGPVLIVNFPKNIEELLEIKKSETPIDGLFALCVKDDINNADYQNLIVLKIFGKSTVHLLKIDKSLEDSISLIKNVTKADSYPNKRKPLKLVFLCVQQETEECIIGFLKQNLGFASLSAKALKTFDSILNRIEKEDVCQKGCILYHMNFLEDDFFTERFMNQFDIIISPASYFSDEVDRLKLQKIFFDCENSPEQISLYITHQILYFT